MENNKLTKEELDTLRTQRGAFAVIMGYLKSERGKIAPSVFNKLADKLGYPKMKKEELIKLAEHIQETDVLKSLYDKGFDRVIRLDEIPDVVEREEMIPESDVFAQITNFLIDNEDNNARLRELRKLQREGVYLNILMDNLKKHLIEEFKGMPRAKYIKTEPSKARKGEKYLVLLLSDWHIGALVYNEDTGGYDFKKLQGSIQSIVDKVLQLADDLNIKHIYTFFLGDLIEHINMRNVNQAFEAEFPATEQIAKGVRIITDTLARLSKDKQVTFGIVGGNHDRFQGNKNDKVYNDNVAYIVIDLLFMIQEDFGQLPNVTLIDNRQDTYEFTRKVAGKNIKVKHGDFEKKKDDVKIPKHIKDEVIDYYIMGHIHTNRFVQEDFARFHVYTSSPMGGNTFAKELGLPTTQGSQLVMVLEEGSDSPMFMPLMLDKEGKVK